METSELLQNNKSFQFLPLVLPSAAKSKRFHGVCVFQCLASDFQTKRLAMNRPFLVGGLDLFLNQSDCGSRLSTTNEKCVNSLSLLSFNSSFTWSWSPLAERKHFIKKVLWIKGENEEDVIIYSGGVKNQLKTFYRSPYLWNCVHREFQSELEETRH